MNVGRFVNKCWSAPTGWGQVVVKTFSKDRLQLSTTQPKLRHLFRQSVVARNQSVFQVVQFMSFSFSVFRRHPTCSHVFKSNVFLFFHILVTFLAHLFEKWLKPLTLFSCWPTKLKLPKLPFAFTLFSYCRSSRAIIKRPTFFALTLFLTASHKQSNNFRFARHFAIFDRTLLNLPWKIIQVFFLISRQERKN